MSTADAQQRSTARVEAWLHEILTDIDHEFTDNSHPLTLQLTACGSEVFARLRHALHALLHDVSATAHSPIETALDALITLSEERIKSSAPKSVELCWRRLYTDSRLLRSLADLCFGAVPGEDEEKFWANAVVRLDMAIIVAGAPGEGRMDMVQDAISMIQTSHLPLGPMPLEFETFHITDSSSTSSSAAPAYRPIPRRTAPPSLTTFLSQHCNTPFILTNFAADWPALTTHPWSSREYLRHATGRGRVVPVEVGADYRSPNWTQQIMDWEEFLDEIGYDIENLRTFDAERDSRQYYLAQHNLLAQFSSLRYDIVVPDYVYSAPKPPQSFPAYKPPANDEGVILNAWVGPKGSMTPAHIDPYFNCYAQIVGQKTVWLAGPEFQAEMYPFEAPKTVNGHQEPSMTNTSRVDVFSPTSVKEFPRFAEVSKHAMVATLDPGDVLIFPPGWWHAMRSEEPSFSVSMWF